MDIQNTEFKYLLIDFRQRPNFYIQHSNPFIREAAGKVYFADISNSSELLDALKNLRISLSDKSMHHYCFSLDGKFEFFERNCSIYKAPMSNAIMPDGFRSGRFECYAHAWESHAKVLRENSIIL